MNRYEYFLGNVPGLPNAAKIRLVKFFGSEEALYRAPEERILTAPGLKDPERESMLHFRRTFDIDREWESLLSKEISIVTSFDPAYPAKLSEVYNPPYLLYYKGTLPKADEDLSAMVGSRECSGYGKKMAVELAGALAKNGFGIVSGMALGIDGFAHTGALEAGGRTYALLGCGVDVIYPKKHEDMYYQIIRNGAVISELPPGQAPLRQNFPSRNRLISGLSSRVIVVEARERSGSLITADFALEQGRDVYAVPGRLTDPMSAGTNRLIYEGANIILSKEQVLSDFLGLSADHVWPRQNNLSDEHNSENSVDNSLEKDERVVYSIFDFYPKNLEEACKETDYSPLSFLSIVMKLCDRGLLKEVFKNEYVKC
ncbi:MAG: DNA-processing protein DprA [Lachnospiraceae bacterium]|nr:DNA-processing protein DprA [Lachnospiraceae bacterium]